jgi:RNA polymerase sigma-70 factor (family 1)
MVQRNKHDMAAEFVRSFQRGEEKGFNFFFREYYAALTFYCFQFIKDKPAAEEIAGDALMKLWERHENFDNIPSIKSFLYTTTRNASLNWIRQQKRNSQRIRDIAYLSEKNETAFTSQIIETELYREIFLAMQTLPPKCRQVFKMLFIEGKNFQQIAGELGLSASTIRSQKAKALLLLKQRVTLAWLLLFLVL